MKKLILLLTLTMMFGQTKLETRVYEHSLSMAGNSVEYIDIENLTGFNLDYAHLKIFLINNLNSNDNSILLLEFSREDDFEYPDAEYVYDQQETWQGDAVNLRTDGSVNYNYNSDFYTINGGNGKVIYNGSNSIRFRLIGGSFNADILISVNAPFPDMDTGYIEDGFDYCVEPGANLMSYPCDSAVALLDAIPSDALSQFEGIIGAGSAATNLNGTWVGSITNLTPGAGYWIKSNSALCFNYDCSEN